MGFMIIWTIGFMILMYLFYQYTENTIKKRRNYKDRTKGDFVSLSAFIKNLKALKNILITDNYDLAIDYLDYAWIENNSNKDIRDIIKDLHIDLKIKNLINNEYYDLKIGTPLTYEVLLNMENQDEWILNIHPKDIEYAIEKGDIRGKFQNTQAYITLSKLGEMNVVVFCFLEIWWNLIHLYLVELAKNEGVVK